MSIPRILILGYGNPGRGDDGLGPETVNRLETLRQHGLLPSTSNLTLLTDFQLQVEHVLDMEGQDLCLFIDAHLKAPLPFSFERVYPEAVPSFSTHRVSPGTLLKVHEDLKGPSPPAFALGIPATAFDLGAPLSEEAQNALDEAFRWVEYLIKHPETAIWDKLSRSLRSLYVDADPSPPSKAPPLVQDP